MPRASSPTPAPATGSRSGPAGLGQVAGKVFRIGHLGSLTDVMMLSGLATAEMVMADLGLDIRLGSGVAAAQEVYRNTAATVALAAE